MRARTIKNACLMAGCLALAVFAFGRSPGLAAPPVTANPADLRGQSNGAAVETVRWHGGWGPRYGWRGGWGYRYYHPWRWGGYYRPYYGFGIGIYSPYYGYPTYYGYPYGYGYTYGYAPYGYVYPGYGYMYYGW